VPSFLLDHAELRQLGRRALEAAGSASGEAAIVADHLVDANLAGHDSHGIGLLPMYLNDRRTDMVRANRHVRIEGDGGPITRFDGGMGFGQVIVGEAIAHGVATAGTHGLAILGIRETYHIGRVGAYAEQAAAAGLVSIFFVNVVGGTPVVAPFGGGDSRLQTNPIAIGVPAAEGSTPIILDFATSRIPVGKALVAAHEGRPVEPGTLLDSVGAPSVDPAVLFRRPAGAILPFGEHKGYGLALICEALAGALTGSRVNRQREPTDRMTNGVLAILIDPAQLTELPLFHDEIAAMVRHVKASPPASPGRPVLVAGEPERKARATRLATGIPIDETSWRQIRAAVAAAGVGS
jgi:uncharacterized oxidoreductase